MQGALPPDQGIQDVFAKQIKEKMIDLGIDKQPLGIDIMELPMLRALEAAGIGKGGKGAQGGQRGQGRPIHHVILSYMIELFLPRLSAVNSAYYLHIPKVSGG